MIDPDRLPVHALDALVARCLVELDVAAATVLVIDPDGALKVAAASSNRSRQLEGFAVATDSGPGVDAARTGAQVCCPQIDTDVAGWPGYAAAARWTRFRAAHALPLRHGGKLLGALTLLNTCPRTLTEADRDLGQALADHSYDTTPLRSPPRRRRRWGLRRP